MVNINYATVIDPVMHDIRRRVPDFAGMQPGERVLDVCCGSGAQVCEYRRRGLDALGLDNSLQMLELAEKYYGHCGAHSSSFILGDAAQLPFDDGSFNYTSVSMALHDKEASLADVIVEEMRRVTREDGKLVFVDYSFPLPHNGAGYLMRFIEFLAGGQHYRSFRRYLVSGGLKGLFAGHGLKQTACTTFKGGSISLVLAANGGQV